MTATRSWRERGCFCDPECARYGDCCRDAPAAAAVPGAFSCRPAVPLTPLPAAAAPPGHWYMRDACPRGAAAHRLCERPTSARVDPLAALPVTSRDSGVTYRNVYCAICHGDTARLEFWRVRATCPAVSESLDAAAVLEYGVCPARPEADRLNLMAKQLPQVAPGRPLGARQLQEDATSVTKN
ncbi:uncharacterized protein LOC119094905 [Pollicipes pollicipes]|uniref:uncharacterized protein LOC119094905 n=1 Tax=Pollicipes pollicipes TaxID=41117 RepID=UPI0018859999|nr:uncharacterized protein LOC119094905 [Pollicipes pollicipes]